MGIEQGSRWVTIEEQIKNDPAAARGRILDEQQPLLAYYGKRLQGYGVQEEAVRAVRDIIIVEETFRSSLTNGQYVSEEEKGKHELVIEQSEAQRKRALYKMTEQVYVNMRSMHRKMPTSLSAEDAIDMSQTYVNDFVDLTTALERVRLCDDSSEELLKVYNENFPAYW